MAPALEKGLLASSQLLKDVSIFKLALILGVGYYAAWVFYQLFLSPLRNIPGPKLWAISDIPRSRMALSGDGMKEHAALHAKYGRAVRIGPTHVSFSDDKMLKTVAGHRKPGKPEHGKDPAYYGNITDTQQVLTQFSREEHTRHRKLLTHGFSAKSLQAQEPLIKQYIDLLMIKLREKGENGVKALDAVKFYNFTTFDIIGDLVFGEPFGCLQNSDYHPWVALIFEYIKEGTYSRIAQQLFPPLRLLRPILQKTIPKAAQQQELTEAKVLKRTQMEASRPDFMESMISTDKDGNRKLTWGELLANASGLIVAGSETTATALCGITFMLDRHPDAARKLAAEVRSSFRSEDEIDFLSTQHLPYLNAVIEEGLRVYPPAPSDLPRVIGKGGENVSGWELPEGTGVSQWMSTTFRDPALWREPMSFIPERWMGDERFAGDKRDAFTPFSLGPRNCLGMNLAYAEMRVLLARIIWNFDLEVAQDSKMWLEEMKVWSLYKKGPLNVYFKPRKV